MREQQRGLKVLFRSCSTAILSSRVSIKMTQFVRHLFVNFHRTVIDVTVLLLDHIFENFNQCHLLLVG